MDDEEITQRISKEGIVVPGFQMKPKDLRLTKLRSKIFYIRKTSLDRSNFLRASDNSIPSSNEIESFKEALAKVYTTDAGILVTTIHDLFTRVLRIPFDKIRSRALQSNRMSLARALRALQQKKKLNYLSWALYKLKFQQKKKRLGEESIPVSPTRRQLPRRTDYLSKPRMVLNPRHLLPQLLQTTFSNNERILSRWSFHRLSKHSQHKYWKYYVPIRNLCVVVMGRLAGAFAFMRSMCYHNKKVISVTLFQMEFKFKGLSADRVRQLNIQIEDLKNSKPTLVKRQERSLRQMEDSVALIAKQVGQWDETVANNQAVLDKLSQAEEKRRSKPSSQDYYPLLKRLYCQYESVSVPFIKRGLILKKYGINLSSLLEWPEVVTAQNIQLKKELQLIEEGLVPETAQKEFRDPRKEILESEVAQLIQIVRGYIRDSYRYKILDRLQSKYMEMQRDYDAIGVLIERGDIDGLKLVFEMN